MDNRVGNIKLGGEQVVDQNGKIAGKVSIIDLILVVAILLLVVGFIYRHASPRISNIISGGTPLTIVLEAEGHRHFTADAVAVGDVIFRMHERQPLGVISEVELLPSFYLMQRTDGVAVRAQQEHRVTIRVTIEGSGSVDNRGFFVNGTDHLAVGSEVSLVTNMVNLPNARVVAVQETVVLD